MTRCFIAIDLPEEIKKEILKIQKQIPEFKGKLIEEENLHLTLKFLSEITNEKADLAKEKLKKIKFNKFNAKLGEIGVFSESFIRIVWVKLENCDELQKEIDSSLNGLFKKEERFMSHLTIARVKSIKDKKEFINKLNEIKARHTEFEVNSFALKKSTLTEKGPIYEDLLEIKLK